MSIKIINYAAVKEVEISPDKVDTKVNDTMGLTKRSLIMSQKEHILD
jgi:hypothetical protein